MELSGQMAKQILIDSYFGMVRTAIAEGQELVDYYEESPEQGRNKGNIYRGVVKRVDAPIQAAFVKFAGGRDGFLPLRDAAAGSPPKPGETVLVQVVKDEVGDKGAALTSKLSLSGRYLVYIPERDGEGGISSKITDEERAALKKAMAELQVPEGASLILRTAALDKGVAELQADLDRLIEAHREIVDKFSQGKEPGLLFREAPPALRYLREYYTEDVERIWVNQEDVLDQCRQFFYLYEPKSASKVVFSQDGPLLFQRLGLEADAEKLSSRKVALPSGANIVIDQAEALVAIDVNSAKAGGRPEEAKAKAKGRGKGRGQRAGGDLEETVFAVNGEAAVEIARQLRLRDLGGIIIVDFIDMEQEKHRRQIEDIMRKALAQDKAKIKVYEISPLGIMQISRQRLRKAGHQFSRLGCEACQGRGWHPSPSAGAMAALRKLEERLHGKKAGQSLSVSVPYPVANKLMNEFREHVVGMEKRYGCSIKLNALPAASGEPTVAVLGGGDAAPGRDARPAEGQGPARRENRPQERQGDARQAGRPEGRQAAAGDPGRRGGRGGERDAAAGSRRDGRDGRRQTPDQGRPERGERPERQPQERAAQGQEAQAADAQGPESHGSGPGSRSGRDGRRGRGRDRERNGNRDARGPGRIGPMPVERETGGPLPERGPGSGFPAAGEPVAMDAMPPGGMQAAVREIVNAEANLAAEAAGQKGPRGHRGRRGGRGRGRGRSEGSAPQAANGPLPAAATPIAPVRSEPSAAPAPALAPAKRVREPAKVDGGKPQAAGRAPARPAVKEKEAKAVKEGARPRVRARRPAAARGGAPEGGTAPGTAGD